MLNRDTRSNFDTLVSMLYKYRVDVLVILNETNEERKVNFSQSNVIKNYSENILSQNKDIIKKQLKFTLKVSRN